MAAIDAIRPGDFVRRWCDPDGPDEGTVEIVSREKNEIRIELDRWCGQCISDSPIIWFGSPQDWTVCRRRK